MHPNTAHLLSLFKFDHLPDDLRRISKPFASLAHTIAHGPQNPETSAALRKLIEAKDCAVRAHVGQKPPVEDPEELQRLDDEHTNAVTKLRDTIDAKLGSDRIHAVTAVMAVSDTHALATLLQDKGLITATEWLTARYKSTNTAVEDFDAFDRPANDKDT